MQKISTKHFYSVEINGKTCSMFMYQGGIWPEILIFFSGSLTLQIALKNLKKKQTNKQKHLRQESKSVQEMENESKLKVVFLKQRNPHTLHSNHGKMEQISKYRAGRAPGLAGTPWGSKCQQSNKTHNAKPDPSPKACKHQVSVEALAGAFSNRFYTKSPFSVEAARARSC